MHRKLGKLFIFLFVLSAFFSCKFTALQDKASIIINLPYGSAKRAAGDVSYTFTVDVFAGTEATETPLYSKTASSGEAVIFDEVEPGDYTVRVRVYDTEFLDFVLYEGISTESVYAGMTKNFNIILKATDGSGFLFTGIPGVDNYVQLEISDGILMTRTVTKDGITPMNYYWFCNGTFLDEFTGMSEMIAETEAAYNVVVLFSDGSYDDCLLLMGEKTESEYTKQNTKTADFAFTFTYLDLTSMSDISMTEDVTLDIFDIADISMVSPVKSFKTSDAKLITTEQLLTFKSLLFTSSLKSGFYLARISSNLTLSTGSDDPMKMPQTYTKLLYVKSGYMTSFGLMDIYTMNIGNNGDKTIYIDLNYTEGQVVRWESPDDVVYTENPEEGVYCSAGTTARLQDPTKDGFEFAGWGKMSGGRIVLAPTSEVYDDETGSHSFVVDEIMSGTKYYALWNYKIAFYMDDDAEWDAPSDPQTPVSPFDDSGSIKMYTVPEDGFILNVPTREGYMFMGWGEDTASGVVTTTKFDWSTGTTSKTITMPGITTNDAVTLYPMWGQYISFAPNGTNVKWKGPGDGSEKDFDSVNKKSFTTASAPDKIENPRRQGYIFAGWSNDPDSNESVLTPSSTDGYYAFSLDGISSGTILYAIWKKTVTFDFSRVTSYTTTWIKPGETEVSTVSSNTVTVDVFKGESLKIQIPAISGRFFKGWVVNSDNDLCNLLTYYDEKETDDEPVSHPYVHSYAKLNYDDISQNVTLILDSQPLTGSGETAGHIFTNIKSLWNNTTLYSNVYKEATVESINDVLSSYSTGTATDSYVFFLSCDITDINTSIYAFNNSTYKFFALGTDVLLEMAETESAASIFNIGTSSSDMCSVEIANTTGDDETERPWLVHTIILSGGLDRDAKGTHEIGTKIDNVSSNKGHSNPIINLRKNKLTIGTNCVLANNYISDPDTGYGGAIYTAPDAEYSLFIKPQARIMNNKVSKKGGGIIIQGKGNEINIEGQITNNYATYGGGLAICNMNEDSASCILGACYISENYAEANGGAIIVDNDDNDVDKETSEINYVTCCDENMTIINNISNNGVGGFYCSSPSYLKLTILGTIIFYTNNSTQSADVENPNFFLPEGTEVIFNDLDSIITDGVGQHILNEDSLDENKTSEDVAW